MFRPMRRFRGRWFRPPDFLFIMARIKDSAEFSVRCYTSDFIPRVTSHHFSIADVFADLVRPHQGESSRFSLDESAPPAQWERQSDFNRIDANCVFTFLGDRVYFGSQAIKAAKDVQHGSSAVAGFTLKARAQSQNCVMRPGSGRDPKGATGFKTLRWKGLKGGAWQSYKPLRFPGATFITHAAQNPDSEVEAQTLDPLAQNAQIQVTLLWRGVAATQTQPAAFRYLWGNNSLSVVFRFNSPPTVEYYADGGWHLWKTLEGAGATTFDNGTQTHLTILRIAGRLVVGIDHDYFECLGSGRAVGTGSGPNATYDLRDVSWPKGVNRVRSFGVSVMVGVAKLVFLDALSEKDKKGVRDGKLKLPSSTPSGFAPRRGEIERDVPRPGLTPRMDSEAQIGDGYAGGWAKDGTKSEVKTEILPGKVRYTLSLTGSADGINAPFCNKLTARYLGLFSVDNAPFLDIIKACVSGRETTAFPPLAPGAEWSLEIDRSALDLLSGEWVTYVKAFNPLEIMMRWKYSDGTRSEWVGRLRGYVSSLSLSVNQANKWMMTLGGRDPMWRLQKPNSIIDHNYYPLDWLWAAQGGAPLYGWQCVKEILSIAQGEDEGNRLTTYLPPFHYALLSATTDNGGFLPSTQPPHGNGFRFPPPWKSAPGDWIKTFCKYDYAQFFYGYPSGALAGTSQITGATIPITGTSELTTPWPVPIYGQYPLIVAGRPTWTIPDANYVSGDLNLLAFMAEVTGLPEENINRILVWGNPPQGAGADLPFPAIRQAERQLQNDDPNAAIFSWARTLVHEGPQFFYPGAAEIHAERVMALYRNKKIRRFRFECRGEERMQWGDKALPMMINAGGAGGNYSDPHLDVNGEVFRIWRLQNSYRFHETGQNQFKTSATCLPLSALGY